MSGDIFVARARVDGREARGVGIATKILREEKMRKAEMEKRRGLLNCLKVTPSVLGKDERGNRPAPPLSLGRDAAAIISSVVSLRSRTTLPSLPGFALLLDA